MKLSYEVKQRLKQRATDIREWLRSNFPQIAKEQRHLDSGSVERYYWHYGYLMALLDTLALDKKTCPKCGAIGIRLKALEEICKDDRPRYTCPNFLKGSCDIEYFNENGAF